MTDMLTRDAPGSVTGEPLEWWEHLRVWRARRWQRFGERHPALVRVLGLARWGLLALGLVWLLVVGAWLPYVGAAIGAYIGCLWILLCCTWAARTRTLSVGTVLRVFAFSVPWSVVIGLIGTWLSDLVFVTAEEADAGGVAADLSGSAVEAAGAFTAIAGLTEESLKLLPVALVVVLAPRRARRFAIIDWLLLGMASGVTFLAVEAVNARLFLGDPGMDTGVLDFCGYYDNVDQRLDCYDVGDFGIWPIGSGSSAGSEFANYAGHHVLTALVAVVVGLAIAAWRSSGSSRVPVMTRALALAAPVLMFWIAVVDHMAVNAVTRGDDDVWLTSETTTIPWIVRLTFQVTGGGDGRVLLLVVLFVAAVVIDARRYARYGYPISGTAAGTHPDGPVVEGAGSAREDGLLAWLVGQARTDVRRASAAVREALQDALPRLSQPSRQRMDPVQPGRGARILAGGGQVWRVLWLDVAEGVAAHSREPGVSRGHAIWDGRAFWSMQRRARQLVCHVDADRFAPGRLPVLRYRLMGIAALAALLAAGLVAAPVVAGAIGPELTTGDDSSWFWLSGQLDIIAQWWDGLSTGEQLAIGIAGAAILAVPFGFTGGLFAAGIGTYIADHGTGIGDLIEDPETTVRDYAANTSPGELALDLGELLLTFVPPAFGAAFGSVVGRGAKQMARESRTDPTFWSRYRAELAARSEAGWIRFDGFLTRPRGYPDWVAYGGKPRGRLPADFEPGWAAVRQSEKGMAYQQQITGMGRLPDGGVPEYVVRNPANGQPVAFDGRVMRGDPPQEVFLEAKDGYAELAINPDQPWTRGMKDTIVDQAERQTQALPDGAVLEWKVSDPRGAEAIQKILEGEDFFNIKVDYIPKG